MADPAPSLDRATILRALAALSDELGRAGVTGELCVFGGTAMVLAFAARVSTRDIDALFQPTSLVRDAARVVARDLGLPEDWLNDGVKGFVSGRHETTTANLPQFPNLRVAMPVPQYLLAMKCMASRLGTAAGEASDLADIRCLIRYLGLRAAREVLDLVAQYYPPDRIPVRAQYLVEGLFEEGAP